MRNEREPRLSFAEGGYCFKGRGVVTITV